MMHHDYLLCSLVYYTAQAATRLAWDRPDRKAHLSAWLWFTIAANPHILFTQT
jgi:hypothetical protein